MPERIKVGNKIKIIENGVIHDAPIQSSAPWRGIVFAFAMLLAAIMALGELVRLLT